MTLGNILRGLCFASGMVVGAASAIARSGKTRSFAAKNASPYSRTVQDPPVRRDYFSITKLRGAAGVRSQWILQGFGRCECFLLFDTWREAMDQACFRLESLAPADLVALSRLG